MSDLTVPYVPMSKFNLQIGGIYAIWLRELKRALRDRGQLIGGVTRPLIYVLIMGIGLNPYFRGEVYGEVKFVIPFTYLQFIFPAVIALNILYTSVQSAVSVIWDREFGFLREVLVSPLPRVIILLGKVLGGATVAMFHGAIVLVLAPYADISLTPLSIAKGLLLMFLLAFAITSAGVIIASRVRSFEGFGVFSNVVNLVQFNPLTYAVDSFRGAFIGFHQFEPSIGPFVLISMAVFFFSWALVEFRKA
mgnify:CR=1 FL=1